MYSKLLSMLLKSVAFTKISFCQYRTRYYCMTESWCLILPKLDSRYLNNICCLFEYLILLRFLTNTFVPFARLYICSHFPLQIPSLVVKSHPPTFNLVLRADTPIFLLFGFQSDPISNFAFQFPLLPLCTLKLIYPY